VLFAKFQPVHAQTLTPLRGVVADGSGQLAASDATKQQAGKAAMQVPTIAALQALSTNLNDGQLIHIGGYWTNGDGDGGGGLFRLDASDTTRTSNGGTMIVSSAWQRFPAITTDGELSARRWGFIGDGADESSKFRTLVAELIAGTIPRRIIWPAGTFACSHALRFTNGFAFVGAGIGSCSVNPHATIRRERCLSHGGCV